MKSRVTSFLCVLALLGCAGCRSAYYATWEKFGVHKRDLLKKRVVAARDEQKEAGEEFKDALTHLKQLYGFEGGKLEKTYDQLKEDYDQSSAKAEAVRKRIRDMETVASDLFAEWEKEAGEISSSDLRAKSRAQLKETKKRYEDLHQALLQAEKSMEPVLVQFRDQVLFLKHNLNAQAIASLKGEATSIQTDIAQLIEDMNAAIRRADEFVRAMP